MVSSDWQVCQARRDDMNRTTLAGQACQRQFDEHIERFLQHLRVAGYAERTLRKKDGLCEALLDGLKKKALPLPISMTGLGLHSYPARPEGRRTLSQFSEEQFGSFCDSFDQEPAKHLRRRQRAPRGGASFFGIMKTIYATIAALQRTLFMSMFR
jgi:hypothetical protein